jgi:hypothetical protein
MVFILGQIDFYMVDDNLAKGMTVLEVRPTMDKIVFGKPGGGEAVVWQGPQMLVLHSGENRAKLGRFDMPAGTYQGGKLHLGEIQVDIQADLSVMASPEGQVASPDKYEEVFKIMTTQMEGEYGGFKIRVLNSSLNGNIAKYTISTSMPPQDMPIPQIQYPGTSGPDITLDITLGPDGRPDPSQIKVLLDMPPGVGPGMEAAMPNIPGVEFR